MPTKSETVLEGLKDQIADYFDSVAWTGEDVTVLRNADVPMKIEGGGLVIIRDGNPGDPERCLGDGAPFYYSHDIPIEIYVQDIEQADRDELFDDLSAGVGAAIETDKTLAGECKGCLYSKPEGETNAVEGAAPIKSATIPTTFDYETTTPLS